MFDRQKKLERELESLKAKAASSATHDLAGQAHDVAGFTRRRRARRRARREGAARRRRWAQAEARRLRRAARSASDGKVALAAASTAARSRRSRRAMSSPTLPRRSAARAAAAPTWRRAAASTRRRSMPALAGLAGVDSGARRREAASARARPVHCACRRPWLVSVGLRYRRRSVEVGRRSGFGTGTSSLQGRGQRGRLIPESGRSHVVREVSHAAERQSIDPTTC